MKLAEVVILPNDFGLSELTDSKKLSEKKREILYTLITHQCQWAVGEASTMTKFGTINEHRYSFTPVKNLSL
ncbi:hypothetical protein [Isorropodon fossajaponicum symbiont]|uniref:hypothetical protein n=1 Tax=Isorropodon fossajaponicum symbiont TaxID=883811 RepID=UPI002479D203|nr:hypothetical protein [Isorropodon fossajaponicum symbiont]